MPQLLAIDWDQREARFIVAGASRGNLRVGAVATVRFDDAAPPKEEEGDEAAAEARSEADLRLAEALRAAIREHKAGRATAMLGVDRGSVELVHLTLPPAADNELPELVANQAVRESTMLVDGAAMDFLAMTDDPSQPRKITAAVLPAARLARINAICATAGITPHRMLLRPFASASLFAQTVSPPEDVCLLVNRVADEVDLTVLVRGKVIFSRTARLPGEADQETTLQRLVAEINRTMAVSQESMVGESEVEGIYIFGTPGDQQDLVDEIREELALPAMVIDPFVAVDVAPGVVPDNAGSFASLLGMLLDEARGGTHAIDFLHPRKPPEPKSHRRSILMAAALAVVLVAIGGYYIWDRLAKVDAVNQELASELADLKDLMKQAARKKEVVQTITQWRAGDVNWLDELRDLSIRFPSSRDAIVLKMTLSSARGNGGDIQFSGLVRDPSIVRRMEDNIRDDFHQIRSKRVGERDRDKDYTWRFETSMSVAKRDKSQFTSHLPAPPEPPPSSEAADAPETPSPTAAPAP